MKLKHQIHDNSKVRKAIEEKFASQCERDTAWMVVKLIRELYPEVNELLKGELQEEWEE